MAPQRGSARSDWGEKSQTSSLQYSSSPDDGWTPARRQISHASHTSRAASRPRVGREGASGKSSTIGLLPVSQQTTQDRDSGSVTAVYCGGKMQQRAVLLDSPLGPPQRQHQHQHQQPVARLFSDDRQLRGRRREPPQQSSAKPPPLGAALADHFAVFQARRQGTPTGLRHDLYAKVLHAPGGAQAPHKSAYEHMSHRILGFSVMLQSNSVVDSMVVDGQMFCRCGSKILCACGSEDVTGWCKLV